MVWTLAAASLILAAACGPTNDLLPGNGGSGGSSSHSNGSGNGGANSGGAGTGGEPIFTTGSGSGSGSGSGGAPDDCGNVLQGIVRDFSPATHPDFESALGSDKGIVQADLGADKKPVYAGNPTTPTTNGQMYFDQWYRDVQGVNVALPITLTLTPSGGNVYTFDNQVFFPIDGQGLGDEGNPHNYHFTLEIHTHFEYKGGEIFTFTGDDDLFTFINGKLAIDLGGVHGSESGSVDLDAMAGALGLTKGTVYPLDFFFAERHTVDSHFRIDTTIGCFTPPPPPQ